MSKMGRYALRVREAQADEARAGMGLAPGRLFLVQGFPVHGDTKDVEEVLRAQQWHAVVLPERRRVHRGLFEWQVRAQAPPPREKIALNFGDLRVRLGIRPVAKISKAEEKAVRPPPRTWSEAVHPGAQRPMWGVVQDSDWEEGVENEENAKQNGQPMNGAGSQTQHNEESDQNMQDEDDETTVEDDEDLELLGQHRALGGSSAAWRAAVGLPKPKKLPKRRRQNLENDEDPVSQLTEQATNLQDQMNGMASSLKNDVQSMLRDLVTTQMAQLSQQLMQQVHQSTGAAGANASDPQL